MNGKAEQSIQPPDSSCCLAQINVFNLIACHVEAAELISIFSAKVKEHCLKHIRQKLHHVQVKIRFDAAEALSELQRLNLVTETSDGFWPCSTRDALDVLKDHWEDLLLDAKHAAVLKG